jgi:SAM-dependent methyltransferase
MTAAFQPVARTEAPCKCCGAAAPLYGVVDFHRNCEVRRRHPLPVSGIPIYYHRCPACGFIFTTAFDQFTKEDFARYIYNSDYVFVDPDYKEERPRGNAGLVGNLFPTITPERLLDYGSGDGLLVDVLRATGRFKADAYDPFVPRHATRPAQRYDCIVSFEVLEHSPTPAQTIADMNSLLTENGLIVLSTLLQPADIDQQGLNWWYVGPRNGHVSLFSRASLEKLVAPFGFRHGWFNDNLHVLFREVPAFAKHLIRVG